MPLANLAGEEYTFYASWVSDRDLDMAFPVDSAAWVGAPALYKHSPYGIIGLNRVGQRFDDLVKVAKNCAIQIS